jgi:hypothetical protein
MPTIVYAFETSADRKDILMVRSIRCHDFSAAEPQV